MLLQRDSSKQEGRVGAKHKHYSFPPMQTPWGQGAISARFRYSLGIPEKDVQSINGKATFWDKVGSCGEGAGFWGPQSGEASRVPHPCFNTGASSLQSVRLPYRYLHSAYSLPELHFDSANVDYGPCQVLGVDGLGSLVPASLSLSD